MAVISRLLPSVCCIRVDLVLVQALPDTVLAHEDKVRRGLGVADPRIADCRLHLAILLALAHPEFGRTVRGPSVRVLLHRRLEEHVSRAVSHVSVATPVLRDDAHLVKF